MLLTDVCKLSSKYAKNTYIISHNSRVDQIVRNNIILWRERRTVHESVTTDQQTTG